MQILVVVASTLASLILSSYADQGSVSTLHEHGLVGPKSTVNAARRVHYKMTEYLRCSLFAHGALHCGGVGRGVVTSHTQRQRLTYSCWSLLRWLLPLLFCCSLSPSGRERVKEFGGIYLMSCTRRKGDKYYFPYQSRSPRCASSLGSLRKVSFLATETIPSPQASARGRVIFSA